MKLYFVRHGQTATNAGGANNYSTDESLSQPGIQQAKQLAEELKDITFDVIISSPLKRAYQTAELLNEYHHLPIKVDEVWRERDADVHIDMAFWIELFDFDKNIHHKNTESLNNFFQRIYTAIEDLKQEYGDKTVLLVSHGGVQHALYAYANKLPWSGNIRISPMSNCEYRVYDL